VAGSDEEHGSVKPSEQRGGTTPDATEGREKGLWAGTAADGIDKLTSVEKHNKR
jgi:hypothetical protein